MAKDKKAANEEYKAAHRQLEAVAKRDKRTGNREETPEYWAANARATEAAKHVSWWKR